MEKSHWRLGFSEMEPMWVVLTSQRPYDAYDRNHCSSRNSLRGITSVKFSRVVQIHSKVSENRAIYFSS